MSFIMINDSYAVQPPLRHNIFMGHIGSSRLQRVLSQWTWTKPEPRKWCSSEPEPNPNC